MARNQELGRQYAQARASCTGDWRTVARRYDLIRALQLPGLARKSGLLTMILFERRPQPRPTRNRRREMAKRSIARLPESGQEYDGPQATWRKNPEFAKREIVKPKFACCETDPTAGPRACSRARSRAYSEHVIEHILEHTWSMSWSMFWSISWSRS